MRQKIVPSQPEAKAGERLDKMRAYFRPRVATMLLLGFSSGLPFYLTGNTLGYWLRDEGTSLTTIGFLSWVGIAYSLKPLWAPVIDRSDAPLLGWMGRRRGWMLVTQLFICFGLISISVTGPHGESKWLTTQMNSVCCPLPISSVIASQLSPPSRLS